MASVYKQQFDRLCAILKENRTIAVSQHLARITDHPKSAILLSQLTYWSSHGRDIIANHGWVYKTREEWWRETGLSRKELETARAHLRRLGLIEELRFGHPARLWYRIRCDQLAVALNRYRTATLPENLSFEFMREEGQLMREALGPTVAYHRVLSELSGGVNAGLLLSRLLHYQRRTVERGSMWFAITQRDWKAELALNRRQLENAQQKLCQLGLIKETLTRDTRLRLFTQVDPVRLLELIGPAMTRLDPKHSDYAGARATENMPSNGRLSPSRGNDLDPGPGDSTEGPIPPLGVGEKDPLGTEPFGRSSRSETDIVNARVNRITRVLSTETTTTSGPSQNESQVVVVGRQTKRNLFWPKFMSSGDRSQLERSYADVPGDVMQEFLDEMAGNQRTRTIHNPIGYVRRCHKLWTEGQWRPEVAEHERQRREREQTLSVKAAAIAAPTTPADPAVREAERAKQQAILQRIKSRGL